MNETTNDTEFANALSQYHEWLKEEEKKPKPEVPEFRFYYETVHNRGIFWTNHKPDYLDDSTPYVVINLQDIKNMTESRQPGNYRFVDGAPVYDPEDILVRNRRVQPDLFKPFDPVKAKVNTVPGHAALPITDADKK